MRQLSPQDAMFAYMEAAKSPSQLAWLNIYDPSTAPGGKVRFKDILRHVESRLHTVPFFRQKLKFVPGSLGEPFWVDDPDFDLERHIRHVALPAPGDWRQLCILASRLFAPPLDLGRPLWEISVIEGLNNVEGFPPGSFALLVKLHHAAIDGVSGVDVTTTLHDFAPDAEPPLPHSWKPRAEPKGPELMLRSYVNGLAHPGRRIRSVARVVPGFRRLRAAIKAGELSKSPKFKVPKTRFSGPVGPHRVMEARRFPLAAMQSLRGLAAGATVNDVLLTIIGGSMRRYLESKGELPEEQLIATCPVSVRTEKERGQLGNQVGNMFVPLATDVAEPVERLRRVTEATTYAKAVNQLVGARNLTDLSQIMPGVLFGLATRLSARFAGAGVANTTVTNVAGPQDPMYLAGARMVTQFALPPLLHGLGIFHVILSYCGEITVTVLSDRDKLPDPGFYIDCLQQSYDELADASRSGAPPKTGKGKRRGSSTGAQA